jgi:hypothetical protein
MPIRDVPKKLRTLTFLTQVEKLQVEALAKIAGLTTSEWLRQVAIEAIKLSIRETQMVLPAPPEGNGGKYQGLPGFKEMRNDFKLGDDDDGAELLNTK